MDEGSEGATGAGGEEAKVILYYVRSLCLPHPLARLALALACPVPLLTSPPPPRSPHLPCSPCPLLTSLPCLPCPLACLTPLLTSPHCSPHPIAHLIPCLPCPLAKLSNSSCFPCLPHPLLALPLLTSPLADLVPLLTSPYFLPYFLAHFTLLHSSPLCSPWPPTRGARWGKRYFIPGCWVPTTTNEGLGQGCEGVTGARGEGYFVLDFGSPPPIMRGWGIEEEGLFYTRFLGPHHLWPQKVWLQQYLEIEPAPHVHSQNGKSHS